MRLHTRVTRGIHHLHEDPIRIRVEHTNKLWRDFGGFVVTDRFRYLDVEIERCIDLGDEGDNQIIFRKTFLDIMKAAKKNALNPNYRIEKLTASNFDMIVDYDQTVAVMNRSDFLEYLFGLYGVGAVVAFISICISGFWDDRPR